MKHHGKRQCHKGNQKDHHWILRFFHLKITDKQHSDYYHCHMDHQKEIFPASSSQQIKERKDDRHRSDWQTLVIVTKLGGLVLSLLFHYVKVTQTDYRSYTIQAENDHTRNMVHSQTITDHCRKHTKTYHRTYGLPVSISRCSNNYGPDFFTLDGKDVVLVSPQDMLPKDFEYHNGDGTLCLIGKFDEETKTFIPEKDQAVDYGIDYYAMQTVEAPDGRRIMIGWMQNWDTCANNRIPKGKWFGQMSLPRELSIKDGRLIQKPVREIEKLRTNKTEYKNVAFEDVIRLDGVDGRCVDMEITLRPADAQNIYKKFAVRFAQNDTYHTAVSFRPYESVLKIDRKFSGSRRAIIHQRRSLVNSENGEIKLRLILDRFSAEIFVNDGEHVMTATIYTDLEADGISFFADGKVEMDVTKYELKL